LQLYEKIENAYPSRRSGSSSRTSTRAEYRHLGTITIERGRTLTGTVVDSAGRTVAGASVMARDHGLFHNVGRFDPSCALTDAAGAFAIAEIPTSHRGS
jgi:hypothetical protein